MGRARKCWFAFAPLSCITCLGIQLNVHRSEIGLIKERWNDREIEIRISGSCTEIPAMYTSIITPKWWHFHTCLPVVCVCVCTYVEFHVRLSQRRNEIKSNRRERIQCVSHCDIVSIQFQLRLVINIFHFCISFGASEVQSNCERVICPRRNAVQCEAHCVGSKSMYCSDMHWLAATPDTCNKRWRPYTW